ncbi:MAG: enoyl-CoA hydratase-related protein [Gammaproteobacteria bacterium]
MSFQHIEFVLEGGVARITLNRPESANAIDVDMANELLQAATRCETDPMIRAVVLTGKGRFFSGGGNVQSFVAAGDEVAGLLNRIIGPLHAAVGCFSRMSAPLITAINGTAAGAGFSLAISGDVVLAAESAKLTLAYTRIGMSADGGASFHLPRIVGPTRAKELMLLNPVLSAAEAKNSGLVTMVVPDLELEAKTRDLAASLANGPTRAFGEVKRLLLASSHNTLEQQLALEARSMTSLAGNTSDSREGFAAFAEKRSAKFTGR